MSITFGIAARGVAARFSCGVALLLLLALSSALQAQAQVVRVAPTPTPEKTRPKGSITGRVVGEDGQPFAGAQVFARSNAARGSAITKPDGTFKIENLTRAPYLVEAYAPGFFNAAYAEYERGARAFHHLGDDVTLMLARGGVVTGRVLDAKGEPAIGVRVNMVRVRTLEGRAVREISYFTRSLERMTDDRGVYRTYGLLPGVYVVAAGGRISYDFGGGIPHSEETPTFYPSTTRDASAELTLRAGEELADIDIRLRGDRGHVISGSVAGISDAAHARQSTMVSLISTSTTEHHGQAYFYGRATSEGFAFDGLTDGEYDLVAERYTQEEWRKIATASRRVQVKGADVTGLRLTLQPVGSISGRFVFEKPPTAEAKPATTDPKPLSDENKASCAGSAEMLYSDAVIIARREDGARFATEPSTLDTSPDEKGEFALRGLGAGTYRLEFRPGKGYFVTSVRAATVASSKPAPTSKAVAATAATSGATVRLQQGEDAPGIVVTAAYGAASLRGRVAFNVCDCPDEPTRVYLVPQERERADDPLRYAEAAIVREGNSGGSFAFDNISPGRYRLVAGRAATTQGGQEQPTFASDAGRARLRREAESGGSPITLAPCQHADDVVLVYAPAEKSGTVERRD